MLHSLIKCFSLKFKSCDMSAFWLRFGRKKLWLAYLWYILCDFCLIWKKKKKEIQLFDFILKGRNTFASGEAGKDFVSFRKQGKSSILSFLFGKARKLSKKAWNCTIEKLVVLLSVFVNLCSYYLLLFCSFILVFHCLLRWVPIMPQWL